MMTSWILAKMIRVTRVWMMQKPKQVTPQLNTTAIFHIIRYCMDLQQRQSFLKVQFWHKKLIIKFIAAATKKNTATNGVLIIKIAAMARLMSIKYLRKGKILVPSHPKIYLYPSSSSHLFHTKVMKEIKERIVQNTQAIDSMPSIINPEINVNEPEVLNTTLAFSAQKSIMQIGKKI